MGNASHGLTQNLHTTSRLTSMATGWIYGYIWLFIVQLICVTPLSSPSHCQCSQSSPNHWPLLWDSPAFLRPSAHTHTVSTHNTKQMQINIALRFLVCSGFRIKLHSRESKCFAIKHSVLFRFIVRCEQLKWTLYVHTRTKIFNVQITFLKKVNYKNFLKFGV